MARAAEGTTDDQGQPGGLELHCRQQPVEEEFFIVTADGWRLAILGRQAIGPPCGVVLAGHAMMANRRSLDRPRGNGLITTFVEAGFHTYALDVRGHGASGPKAEEGADWSYDDILWFDLPAAITFVHGRHPELPLAVVGHSLVGHVILGLLGQFPELPVIATVSLAANVWIRRLEPSPLRWLKKLLAIRLMNLARLPFGRFPTRYLGLGNEDEASSFVRQFQVLLEQGDWCSLDGGIDYMRNAHRVRRSILAVVGSGDRLLCHPTSSVLFHRRFQGSRIWHWTVGGGDFGLPWGYEPDHMQVVTDPRSRPVWHAIAHWLHQRFQEVGQEVEPGFFEAGDRPSWGIDVSRDTRQNQDAPRRT